MTGSAASALVGPLAPDNSYQEAIDIMKRPLGDTYDLELEYMNKLRRAENVTLSNDLRGLRRLHDYLQTNIQELKSHDTNAVSYASMMCEILIKALPKDLTLAYIWRSSAEITGYIR